VTGESWGKRTNGSPEGKVYELGIKGGTQQESNSLGRFPANLIHDGSDEVVDLFPDSTSRQRQKASNSKNSIWNNSFDNDGTNEYNDSGSAARFFYTAKASKSERNAGLEGFDERRLSDRGADGQRDKNSLVTRHTITKNHHPTVKPLSLTKYLATLIKPPTGGRLLVPFSGSGSEMIGALQAGWEYVEGVELTEEYIPIAEARIKYWLEQVKEESKQMELI
jgi:site-specific DNA-methyltransferase (adenine-specific)